MAITELRYGGKQSYNVEFVEKIPEDKIVLLKHKTNAELYILTDINTIDKRNELTLKIESIKFKMQILDKVYQEEKDKLMQEQQKITEDEIRKELGL